MLTLGHMTAYKDLPTTINAFADHTRHALLVVAGQCRDTSLNAQIMAAAHRAPGRVIVFLERVAPEHAHLLYRAADIAVCPYRSDGAWEFFQRVLHPSSVATATAFGCPVAAPRLPAISEITQDHRAWLYPAEAGPASRWPPLSRPRCPSGPRWMGERGGSSTPWSTCASAS